MSLPGIRKFIVKNQLYFYTQTNDISSCGIKSQPFWKKLEVDVILAATCPIPLQKNIMMMHWQTGTHLMRESEKKIRTLQGLNPCNLSLAGQEFYHWFA